MSVARKWAGQRLQGKREISMLGGRGVGGRLVVTVTEALLCLGESRRARLNGNKLSEQPGEERPRKERLGRWCGVYRVTSNLSLQGCCWNSWNSLQK